MSQIDAAIVGAGPAGAWAAYRLARAGARVAVFDPSHPREKPCGGGVTGRALAIVGEALAGTTLPSVIVSRLRFAAALDGNGAKSVAEMDLPSRGLTADTGVAVISRTEFDRALLDAAVRAGARLVTERVLDVAVGPRGVEVQTAGARTAAGWLLGADGANSLVRRRLRRPFLRRQLSIGTGFFAHGVTCPEIEVACVSDPPGYLWSFPRVDHLAIGIGAQADAGATAGQLREMARRWTDGYSKAEGARLVPYSWPIPSLAARDFDDERPAGERFLLLGDAAGLVDPLTREGIYFALVSGDLASAALAEDPGRVSGRYEARLRDEVFPELRRAAELKDGFFRPAFARLMIDALRRSARIREVMADLVCGRQPYRGLRTRLLMTFEFGLAARLLRLRTTPS